MSQTAVENQQSDAPPHGSVDTLARLSAMMFLQYAVWGIWLPYLASYLAKSTDKGGLGFSGNQIGWILGLAGSLGAISAPFIAGQIADRYLNAEKALAILLLVGGVLKFWTGFTSAYIPFLVLSVLYSIAYMPTLSLTNSISFQNLPDRERQFPLVRLWGTLGWIAASNAFTICWLNLSDEAANTRRIADSLKLAGVVSALYAVYAMIALPRTPPARNVAHPLAFARAFALLKHSGFFIVTLAALPISMIHQAYFIRMAPYLTDDVGLKTKWLGPVLGIGQWSEILFLIFLAWAIKRLGYKWVLVLGAAAYAARFAVFARFDSPTPVIIAQALHGLCYGCFFAGAYIYVERVAPADVRHSAQTVFGIVILGLGPILSALYNGYFDRFKTATGAQSYGEFWWSQAAMAAVVVILLLVAFNGRVEGHSAADVVAAR